MRVISKARNIFRLTEIVSLLLEALSGFKYLGYQQLANLAEHPSIPPPVDESIIIMVPLFYPKGLLVP